MKGGKYSARILLSARDSTQFPEVFVGGTKLARNGLYEVNCGVSGLKTFSGQIVLTGTTGNILKYPFKSEYIVGEPSATISNEDLNVIYRGIPNNFNISVPGVAADNVTVRAAGASLTKGIGGRYVIKTNQDKDVAIEVYAKVAGKDLRMGGGLFRVKQIPDPKPFLQFTDGGGAIKQIKGGNMQMGALTSSNLIASYGKDELIKANFKVTQFTMMARGIPSVNVKGSSKLSPAFLNKLIKGDLLVISDIKAEGPDGIPRDLGTIPIQL
jgi:gliding motility-associated protein GldM